MNRRHVNNDTGSIDMDPRHIDRDHRPVYVHANIDPGFKRF